MVKFQISLIFENADIFFFKYDEKFWLEWIIVFEERFVVLVIFAEVASFKFTFILINSVWKHFVTLLCYSDWHPTLLFGPTLLGTFANVSPYSVIRAYSVSDFEKCATLLCYLTPLLIGTSEYFVRVPVPVPRYFGKIQYLFLYLYLANSQVPVPVPRYRFPYLTPTLVPIIFGVWPFWLTPFFFRSITFWRVYG